MTSAQALEIIFPSHLAELGEELVGLSEDAVETSGSGFGGLDASSVLFVALSLPLIKMIGNVLVARVKAGQTTKLRYKGMTIEGVSEATILKALETVKDDLKP
ncbi:hypothetical protein ACCC88_13115 [Sphingomonas sp. Sphisp140]|uniref:hypothetical protein n=1 Tax=unclassified Sphingomonas TaxID=196159 RepID=UPI0039AEF90A